MINGTQKLIILLNEKKLSQVVTKTFNQTHTILDGFYRKQHKNGDLSDRDLYSKFFFQRFYCSEFLSEKQWQACDLQSLYKLSLKFSGEKSDSEIRTLLGYEAEDIRPRPTQNFFRKALRPGLSVFFFLLWRNGAVLLTMQFAPPIFFLCSAENLRRNLPQTIEFVLSFNPRSGYTPATPVVLEKVRTKSRSAQNSGYWLKVFLCTNWYGFSDINPDEFIALHGTCTLKNIDKRVIPTTSPINMNLLLLAMQETKRDLLPEKLANYTYVKEPSQKSKKERKNKKKRISERLKATKITLKKNKSEDAVSKLQSFVEDISGAIINELHVKFAHQYELAYDLFTDDATIHQICDTLKLNDFPQAVFPWWKLFHGFLKKSKYEQERSPLSSFKHYLYYLLYLDVYYHKSGNDSLPAYPSSPSTLIGAYFISRPLDLKDAPVSFLEFMAEIQVVADWKNETLYAKLKTLELFFAYIERFSDGLEGCSGFKQPLYPDDYPKVVKRPWTQKTPLPSRYFKTLVSFVYALKLVQDRLVEMISSGELDSVDFVNTFDKQCGSINFKMMTHSIGFTPLCCHNGRYYPLRELFRFFRYGQYEIEGHDAEIETIWPGDLYLCILMLETGIRKKHLLWLDANNWDRLVDFNEDTDVHPLCVNTDKVHGPWVATVRTQVINILTEMKAWRGRVKTEGFTQERFYNDNVDSKFGKISSIFSYNEQGRPPSDVASCWNAIMLSFQSFLREHGFLEKTFIRLTPSNFKINESVIEDRVAKYVTYTAEDLPYTPLSYSCLHTPHACRATVISEYITVLPPSYIGKNITGQHERLVTYYAKIDKDRMQASQDAQWGITSAPVLEDEMTAVPHAENPNSKMANMLNTNPEEAIKQFGLICMTTEDRNETGLDLIKKRKAVSLALNPTHACPYGNNCPEHIVKRLKGFNKCFICPAAIKGSQNICAISAAKDKANEQIKAAQLTLNNIRKVSPNAEDLIAETEKQIDELAIEAMSWEYTENLLYREMKLKGGVVYIVEDQEEVVAHLERYAMNDAAGYIIKRLRDSVNYPSLTSPEIKAKFSHAKRKLLIANGKLKEAFSDKPDIDPASELYALIKSYMDVYRMPVADVFALLRMPIEELIEEKTNAALLNEEI